MPAAWQAALRRIDTRPGSDVEDLGVWATPVEAIDACEQWLLDNTVRVTAGWEPHGPNGYRLTTGDGTGWTFPHPQRHGVWEAVAAEVQAAEHEIRRATPEQKRIRIRYAVIDTDGDLHIKEGDWRRELAPEGPDRVPLHVECGMCAFAAGRTATDRHPRNLVGAVLAVVFGAACHPYAGPLVFTGWNATEDGPEIQGLRDPQLLTEFHDYARRVLGLDPRESPMPAWWNDRVLRLAEQVRAASTPAQAALPLGGR